MHPDACSTPQRLLQGRSFFGLIDDGFAGLAFLAQRLLQVRHLTSERFALRGVEQLPFALIVADIDRYLCTEGDEAITAAQPPPRRCLLAGSAANDGVLSQAGARVNTGVRAARSMFDQKPRTGKVSRIEGHRNYRNRGAPLFQRLFASLSALFASPTPFWILPSAWFLRPLTCCSSLPVISPAFC